MELNQCADLDMGDTDNTDKLAAYLAMRGPTSDAVSFWQQHEGTYPTLSKLFKKLNSIPASTAHVESFFSDLRYVVEDYRYNLNEETTSLIMLGKHCLK
jgi:hypothetical protein